MAELRRDPITGRWIIVDSENPRLPKDFEVEQHIKKGGVCPFCMGNENLTPPEIEAIRPKPTKPNTTGWVTRVVPNKFPALQVEGELDRRGIGIYDMSNGVGAHEVIIETPEHDKTIADLADGDVQNIIWTYRSRSLDLKGDSRFRYILIFKNYGEPAGASLEHPHSQLIALPVVPKRVLEELKGASQYFEYKERCVFCDIIAQELQEMDRIIVENKNFLVFCPFISRFPYEVWIIPKEHEPDFTTIDNEKVLDLARILRESLLRIKKTFRDPSYNFILHTAPIRDGIREDYHWHIEIMPMLTRVAGFEWGSGFYINPTPPEVAAKFLREVALYG